MYIVSIDTCVLFYTSGATLVVLVAVHLTLAKQWAKMASKLLVVSFFYPIQSRTFSVIVLETPKRDMTKC